MTAKIEWVGGILHSPRLLTRTHDDAPADSHPHVLWMSDDGVVVGIETVSFDALDAQATRSLRRAFAKRAKPTHVRVASDELAAVLEREDLGVTVVRAPTPEIDRALELLLARLVAKEPTYLAADGDAEDVAAMFNGAAELARRLPQLPQMQSMGLDVPQLELRDCLFIIGPESVMIFIDPNDAGRFAAGQESNRLHLSFERGADIDPALRREVSQHGWEVADAASYPHLLACEGSGARMPTRRELRVVEALGSTVAKIPPVAWEGWFVQAMTIVTRGGDTIEARLTFPFSPNLLANLAAIEAARPFDHEERRNLESVLLETIAVHIGRPDEVFARTRRLLDLAADRMKATFATLSPRELEALLDDLPDDEGAATLQELQDIYDYFDAHEHAYNAVAFLRLFERKRSRG